MDGGKEPVLISYKQGYLVLLWRIYFVLSFIAVLKFSNMFIYDISIVALVYT